MLKQAMRYLNHNKILHIDMIESVQRGSGTILRAGPRGVLIFDQAAGLYLISAATAEETVDMIPLMDRPVLAAVHQKHGADLLADAFGLRQTMCCQQAMWEYRDPPEAPSSDIILRTLEPGMEAEILSLYSHEIEYEYIAKRLRAGEMLGAFCNHELAGFIGLHEEGSMGMLEVKANYRRRGIATRLIAGLCALQLRSGRVPFSQIVLGNEQSVKLHQHMGFSISDDCLYWLEQ